MDGEDSIRKSTDVDGSIAGYFFQILLAINELSNLTNDDDEVGIECGADIRIITKRSKYTSIEAKFHKSNMNRYCADIVKTIFNFYNNNYKDEKLYFVTNVDLSTKSDREFFSLISKDGCDKSIKINYIKSCILRYCIKSASNSEKKFNKKYEKYKKKKSKIKTNYIDLLEKDIQEGKERYSDYAYVNSNVDYDKFVDKLQFEFKNSLKEESIKSIEETIKNNLRKNFKENIRNLENKDSEVLNRIINKIISEYLMCTSTNSERGIENLNVQRKTKLSVKKLKELLNKYEKKQYEYFENEIMIKIKDAFKDLENDFIESIEEYGGTYKSRLYSIYFNLRNEFFGMVDKNRYIKIIKEYCLGVTENNIFFAYKNIFHLLAFLTVSSFVNEENKNEKNHSEVACEIEEDSLCNISFSEDERYCYKGIMDFTSYDFKRFLSVFIRETYNSPKLYNTKTVIAGEIFQGGHEPCCYKDENKNLNFVIKQSKIKNINKLNEVYKNIDYKCSECFLLNEEIEDVFKNSMKFILGCKRRI